MRSSAEVDDVLLDGRVRAGLEGLRVEGVDGEEGRVVVTVDPGLRVGLVALDRPEVALTATRETSAMGLREMGEVHSRAFAEVVPGQLLDEVVLGARLDEQFPALRKQEAVREIQP